MHRYNFRNLPHRQEERAIESRVDSEARSSAQSYTVPTDSGYIVESSSVLSPAESSVLHNSGNPVNWVVETDDSMDNMHAQHGAGRFTGGPDGMSVSHLRQSYKTMMSKLKLRPNTENLNENDYFYFLVELTSGQARDRAGELESRMADDLDRRNEARLRAFERELAEYERDKEKHDALGATERAAATAPVKPQKPAVLEVYDDPVGQFWAMIKDLFPEKSTARINEFNSFRMQTNESMSSLTQRMKTLMTVLQRPEGMAAQKLLDAIEPKQFRSEVRRVVWAEDTGDDDLTVDQISRVAIRLEKKRCTEALWSSASQPSTHSDAGRGSAAAKSTGADRPVDNRKCHNCYQFGHIARNCRSPPAQKGHIAPVVQANAAAAPQRGGSAKAESKCYECGEVGHWASQCAKKRAKQQAPGAPKKWCTHHNSSTHDTAECKALQHGAPSAPPLANARAAQAPAAQKNEPRDPAEPTLEELQELWDAHYGRVTGYGACVMSARAATRTGKQQPVSRPAASRQAAPKLHSGLTRQAPKNERRRGRLADMPLGFLPKDFIRTSSPTRPEPAEPAEAEQRAEPDSAQTAAPEVTALAKGKQKETAPEDAAKSAAQGTTRTRVLPQGFQELPSDDPRRQGVIYGPTAPVDTAPALQEADQAPAALGPPPEPAADSIYNPENPRIGALLGKLPGAYHSDPTTGFHRSPRIDNSGPQPALLVNGRVVPNLILDSGAEAVITGPSGAKAMGITPDMIRRRAIVIRGATGQLSDRLDRTLEPVSFELNPGTPDVVTVMAHVVIASHDLPDTLIGMSVMGPASIIPNPRKQRVKYYVDPNTDSERSAYLRCEFPIEYGRSPLHAYTAVIRGYVGAVMPLHIKTPISRLEAETARRRLDQYNTELMTVTTDIFDRSVRALAMPAAPPRPIRNPAFQHIRPLDQSLIDKRAVLDVAGPGLVVIELFSGLMATTEALVRSGLKVRKVYACELDKKAQKVAEFRLGKLHEMYPGLLSPEAFSNVHGALPDNIQDVTRGHIEGLEKPDLIVAGFPCQGFSRAASEAKGLRDPRTKLFTEAIRVVHTVTSVHGPCAYLFENVDASDHPQADVRDEFNDVVKGVLGPGFAFDAVAAGSLAHRNRRWWTNLVPSPLITEMVEKRFKQRPDFRRVQDILEPGRTAQRAKHSGAPGRHRVNETGQPLRALSTFVSLRGSHAYRVGGHSMILAANGEQEEPTALERERAMGFLENSTQAGPPITESDRRRLLGSTMDMHALTFLVSSIKCYQFAFFSD